MGRRLIKRKNTAHRKGFEWAIVSYTYDGMTVREIQSNIHMPSSIKATEVEQRFDSGASEACEYITKNKLTRNIVKSR